MEHLCNETTKNVVIEYDKVMIPLVMKVNKFLNPMGGNMTTKFVDFSINYFFDAPTSTNAANETLLVCELSIFHHVIVWEEDFVKPLTRCKDHANRFSTITLLAKQIVWITSSQIEIKKKFLIVKLFKSLWHCHLRITKLQFLWWFTRIGQMMSRMVIFWPQIIIQL